MTHPRIRAAAAATAALALAAAIVPSPVARAGVTQAVNFSVGAALSNQTAFDNQITATDLINQGSPTFKSQASGGTTSNGGAGGGTFDKLNDGIASSKTVTNTGANDLSGDTYFSNTDLNGSPFTTFFLNTATNASGYDLTTVKTIHGWADTTTFSDQHYTVSYHVVNGGSTYTPLTTVNYVPFTSNVANHHSSIVSLTDTTGTLATHVDAVRFTWSTATGVTGPSGQVVREVEVLGQPSIGPTLPPPPVRANLGVILPLGDSITWGDQASPGPVPGGYRTQLFNALDKNGAANGYDFTFAGSQTSNASTTLANAGQVNNEGHNGYRIDQITNNLISSDGTGGNNGGHWLDGGAGTGRAAVNPNYVLLHIGTNDILQHYDPAGANAPEATFMADLKSRLSNLVDLLTTQRPAAHLFVAGIVPIVAHTNGNGVDENVEVKDYNAYIRDVLVPTFKGMGRDVTFVDQYANFVDGNGNVLTSFFPDNIHPNQAGYDLMGATWAAAIQQSAPEPGTLGAAALVAVGALSRRRRR